MYGIYKTYSHIESASEYECDVYANALENISPNKTPCEETIFCVLRT